MIFANTALEENPRLLSKGKTIVHKFLVFSVCFRSGHDLKKLSLPSFLKISYITWDPVGICSTFNPSRDLSRSLSLGHLTQYFSNISLVPCLNTGSQWIVKVKIGFPS